MTTRSRGRGYGAGLRGGPHSPRLTPDGGAGETPDRVRGVDLTVAGLALGIAVAFLLLGEDSPFRHTAGLLAYGLLAGSGLALVWRRAKPRTVLGLVGVAGMVYLAFDYPGGAATVLILVALYTAAAEGHRGWALAVVAVFAVGGMIFRVAIEGEPMVEVAFVSALYFSVALHGDAVHARRALRVAAQDTLSRAIMEREAEASRKIAGERLRIARDLHDVMAHTITTMSVQAAAATEMLATNPDITAEALSNIRTTSRQAMDELKATISLLREDGSDGGVAPTPDIAQLVELREVADQHGLDYRLDVTGDSRPLPPAVELTVFRVVQEALTNVVRHSQASTVEVMVDSQPDEVEVIVIDDGVGVSGDLRLGFGLQGMRERVEALGGRVEFVTNDGFTVIAGIPARNPRK